MRLYQLLLLLAFCSLSSLSAQVLTVSEEMPMRADTDYRLIGKLGGKTMLLQDRGNRHFITAFDRRMKESWEKELELRGRNIRIIEAVEHNQGFRLIYLFRQGGRNFLQLDAYDPAANLRDSATLENLGSFLGSPDYELTLSQDRSKAMLVINEAQQRFNCLSIDLDSLKLLYNLELKPEDFYFNENYLQTEVTNEGDGFVILEKNNFSSRRKDHVFEVHHLKAADREFSVFEITMGDSLTYDAYFRYDNQNQRLKGGGLYSVRDLVRAQGYFYCAVDPELTGDYHLDFHPFPHSLVENVIGKKLKEKQNRGLDELSVRDITLRRDGGLLLITERNRQLERRSTANQVQVLNNFNNRSLVDFYYDEMIVFSVDPDGTAHWNSILHKKQYSQDDGGVYSSYLMMESPRRLRFLFNDEIRFENTVSEYVLNGRGEFDRNSLFHTRDLELKLRFRDGVQVAANEVVIPSERRNRLRLVTLTY
ncbi:hypothetical protein CEQ90_08030 [Lewinellaceae bacterium SD302]|nr:hypothetical protein CEQ90_08030 [Lewinellaceae bacterium SD302]